MVVGVTLHVIGPDEVRLLSQTRLQYLAGPYEAQPDPDPPLQGGPSGRPPLRAPRESEGVQPRLHRAL